MVNWRAKKWSSAYAPPELAALIYEYSVAPNVPVRQLLAQKDSKALRRPVSLAGRVPVPVQLLWAQKHSEKHQRHYWVNTQTGERTWKKPKEAHTASL
eukprot:COSAG06_NODE_42237_length_383_cov_1.619718_1_plen_97_part_01